MRRLTLLKLLGVGLRMLECAGGGGVVFILRRLGRLDDGVGLDLFVAREFAGVVGLGLIALWAGAWVGFDCFALIEVMGGLGWI